MNFFILLISLPFITVRTLRWLAILQQREYRTDRLKSFLLSNEGKKNFFYLIPKKKDFTRVGLKRPQITPRMAFVLNAFVFFNLLILVLVAKKTVVVFFLITLLIHIFIPLLVWIASWPTWIVFYTYIQNEVAQAEKKIKNNDPIVIGITGSYGKTATKALLAHVLKEKHTVFSTPKSFNTKFSLPKSINQGYKKQEIAILEFAAYTTGEIKALALHFPADIAIITGYTPQHLAIFGSKDAIIHAKSELIESSKDGIPVFYNGQDKEVKEICIKGRAIDPIDFSDDKNIKQFQNIQINSEGYLSFNWNKRLIKTHLVGVHYLTNVAAIIAVCQKLKLSDSQITKGLTSFKPADVFIQSYKLKNGSSVIDDGRSANPKGFEAAINLCKEIKRSKQRAILITSGIVDLGNQSSSIHMHLAKKSKDCFNLIIYTNESGRNEFKKVFGKTKLITKQEDIERILNTLTENDLILIEGKLPIWIRKFFKNASNI